MELEQIHVFHPKDEVCGKWSTTTSTHHHQPSATLRGRSWSAANRKETLSEWEEQGQGSCQLTGTFLSEAKSKIRKGWKEGGVARFQSSIYQNYGWASSKDTVVVIVQWIHYFSASYGCKTLVASAVVQHLLPPSLLCAMLCLLSHRANEESLHQALFQPDFHLFVVFMRLCGSLFTDSLSACEEEEEEEEEEHLNVFTQ